MNLILPFHLDDLLQQQTEEDKRYLEFLRIESMSLGVYTLPVDGEDLQQPHSEDEIYYVVSGKAKIQIADQAYPVQAGSIVFVEKHVDHKFFDIEETLTTVVFFAPAEGSQRND
jgi:mannose-6-phosphate isomerase-like protein (cupin superfamily)